MTTATQTHAPYSSWHTISTTAFREMQILLRSRGVLTTIGILLVAIIGAIGFFTWQTNKDDEGADKTVAIVGTDEQLFDGTDLDTRTAADRAEAEQLVRDGEIDSAIVVDGSTWDVIADGIPDQTVMSTVEELAQAQQHAGALQSLGVDPAEYDAAAPEIQVNALDVEHDAKGAEDQFIRLMTVLFGLFLLIFTVILFAAQVGSRVTEEKSSRVVELVLASVRPMDFLAGKILGAVAFGFLATVLLLGVGAIGLQVSGLGDDFTFDWSILPIMLAAWLLAMLFFGALYAAAGAMVQRTEDLQSTQSPVLILLMISAYVPAFAWSNTDAAWMQVLSWIPPVSIFTAPITYAAGDFTGLQLAASLLIALAATVAVVWFAARIYRRTILNNGRKGKWSDAFTR
nr:putative ABC transporter, permease component [Streptococcus thermophilus]